MRIQRWSRLDFIMNPAAVCFQHKNQIKPATITLDARRCLATGAKSRLVISSGGGGRCSDTAAVVFQRQPLGSMLTFLPCFQAASTAELVQTRHNSSVQRLGSNSLPIQISASFLLVRPLFLSFYDFFKMFDGSLISPPVPQFHFFFINLTLYLFFFFYLFLSSFSLKCIFKMWEHLS